MTQTELKLAEDNMLLVHHVIRKYFKNTSNIAKNYDEYVAIGNLYLCLAAQRYDNSQSEFSTFACSYILGGIKTYINYHSRSLKLPRRCAECYQLLCRYCEIPTNPKPSEIELLIKDHSEITESLIYDTCNAIRKKYLDAFDTNLAQSSSHKYKTYNSLSLEDSDAVFEESLCVSTSIHNAIEKEVSCYYYTDNQRNIIRACLDYIEENGIMSTIAVAKRLNISQSRCSRIYKKFKDNLKERLIHEKLYQ